MRRWTGRRGLASAALVVVLAACTGTPTEESRVDDTRTSVTESDSAVASGENRTEPTSATSSASTLGTSPPDTSADSRPAPATTDTPPDTQSEPATGDAGDSDASSLTAAASEASVGLSVRGETTVGMSSSDSDVVLALTTFETDADGNTSMTFSFPEGALSMEFIHVDGMAYVRMPPEFISAFGLDTTSTDAWLTADEASAAVLGIGCVSPQSFFRPGESGTGCDPLSETAEILPDFVADATLVGRETVRGFQTTIVRLTPTLQDLAGATPDSVSDTENESGDQGDLGDVFQFEAGIRIDIWIDDENRIHRTVIDMGSLMAASSAPTTKGSGIFRNSW